MNLVSFSKQNPVGMEDQAELACFVSKCLLGKLHVANAEGNNSLLVGVSPKICSFDEKVVSFPR